MNTNGKGPENDSKSHLKRTGIEAAVVIFLPAALMALSATELSLLFAMFHVILTGILVGLKKKGEFKGVEFMEHVKIISIVLAATIPILSIAIVSNRLPSEDKMAFLSKYEEAVRLANMERMNPRPGGWNEKRFDSLSLEMTEMATNFARLPFRSIDATVDESKGGGGFFFANPMSGYLIHIEEIRGAWPVPSSKTVSIEKGESSAAVQSSLIEDTTVENKLMKDGERARPSARPERGEGFAE